jgi:hypothetical protein
MASVFYANASGEVMVGRCALPMDCKGSWTRKFRWLGRSRSLGIAPMRLGFVDASPEFLIICLEERNLANHGAGWVPVLMTPL